MLRVKVLRVLYSPVRTFTFNNQTTTENIVLWMLNVSIYLPPLQLDLEFELLKHNNSFILYSKLHKIRATSFGVLPSSGPSQN